jgi:hypothetical protein
MRRRLIAKHRLIGGGLVPNMFVEDECAGIKGFWFGGH